MKKSLLALLLLICLCLTLASCTVLPMGGSGTDGGDDKGENEGGEEGKENEEKANLIYDKKSELYLIIDSFAQGNSEVVSNILSSIDQYKDVSALTKFDAVDSAPHEHEIVIGNADRPGVTALTNYDEYSIAVKGKKIYLNGGSPHATGIAVSEFYKMLQAGAVTDANSTSGSYETAMANYDRSKTYYPTWYDTFDTEGVDLNKWRIMNDPEFSRAGQNGKWSCMSNDSAIVYQTGGQFYVQGMEDEDTYYGGTIANDRHMAFHYGYVEKSAICPDGPGFWSLLWFNGTSDGTNVLGSPEIDLNECFGEGKATQANCHAWPTGLGKSLGYEHTSLDGATYGNDKKVYCPDGKTFADDFHTYGFMWDEDEMGFYLDGENWFTYTTNTTEWDIDVFVNSWMFMELSFSVGRENNGLLCNDLTHEEWQNSSRFIVDWLYLYQLDDGVQGLKIKN